MLEWIAEAAHAWALAVLHDHPARRGRVWAFIAQPRHLERVAEELELWETPVFVLRATSTLPGTAPDPEAAAERLTTLSRLAAGEPGIVLAAPDVLAEPAPSPAALHRVRRAVASGVVLDPAAFAAELTAQAYERVSQVAGRGQFAVRGGIIDLFAWQAAAPLRIEFFDDRVDSLREFDLDSQISTRRLERADLSLTDSEADATVGAYLGADDLPVVIDAEEPAAAVRVYSGASGRAGVAGHPLVAEASPLGRF